MRKLLIKLLGFFGYAVVRIPPSLKIKKESTVRVGSFDLAIPSNNPLIYTYNQKKDFAGELGRIVNAIHGKYPNMKAIDVGANIGDSVAIIKSQHNIPILSVEGEPFTFSYLKKNTEQFKDVTIFNNYLGESKESIGVNLEKEGWNTTIVPSSGASKVIELITLDTLIFDSIGSAQNFKLLKIDTEGFDTIILRGAKRFIDEGRPVIYIEYNRQNMDAISEMGLSTVLALEASGYDDAIFFDDRGRFILATSLRNKELIKQLHEYADGKNGLITYYNICMLHKDDGDVTKRIIEQELVQASIR